MLSLDICFPATITPDTAMSCVLFVWKVEGTRCSKLMSLCTASYLDDFIVLTLSTKKKTKLHESGINIYIQIEIYYQFLKKNESNTKSIFSKISTFQ